jgi:hypothetical protein
LSTDSVCAILEEAGLTTPEEAKMLATRAIQESEIPKAVLARDAKLSRFTLNGWFAKGKAARTPNTESLKQLASGLRRRAAKLLDLARELEAAAGEE